MWQPADVDVLEALTTGYDVDVGCTAHVGDGPALPLDLTVTGGSVTMTEGTGPRLLNGLDFLPAPGLRDALAPGVELRPTWTITWGALGREVVPWGTYVIEDESVTYDRSSGGISVTAPDLWSRVRSLRLGPQQPDGDPLDIAVRWVREAIGSRLTGVRVVRPDRPARVWGQPYSGDRDRAVRDILRTVGYEAFISRDRALVVRPVPDLVGAPVWEISSLGGSATFDSARSTRSSSEVVNSYEVRPAVPGWFRRFYVEDVDPASPTRVSGPLGLRTSDDAVVLPAARTADIAAAGVKAMLRRSTQMAFQTSLTAAANPFTEPGDPGFVLLPAQGGDPWIPEKALAARVTHNLEPGALMSMDLRSDRPFVGDGTP